MDQRLFVVGESVRESEHSVWCCWEASQRSTHVRSRGCVT